MKSFKYTINGNVYKVHINSVVDDIADVEVATLLFPVRQPLLHKALLRLRCQVLSCRLSAT